MLFWQLSRLQCGLVPSHSMDIFVYLPKISVLHRKWITTCFEYTTSSLYKGPMKFIVRFSPSLLYPIVGGFGKDSGGPKLNTDICHAARSHGNCAHISNGMSAKACKQVQRVMLCSNGRKYHHCLEGSKAESTCRVTTYIVDTKCLRFQ